MGPRNPQVAPNESQNNVCALLIHWESVQEHLEIIITKIFGLSVSVTLLFPVYGPSLRPSVTNNVESSF